MFFVLVAIAVLSWVAVIVTFVTNNLAIGIFSMVASLCGLALLVVGSMRERERRADELHAKDRLQSGARYADYAAEERPSHDALVHDDHEVERGIIREDRVLQSDTGPRQRDISGIRAREMIGETHFRPGRDRGGR
jgi:hypothetical protein